MQLASSSCYGPVYIYIAKTAAVSGFQCVCEESTPRVYLSPRGVEFGTPGCDCSGSGIGFRVGAVGAQSTLGCVANSCLENRTINV